MATKVTVQKEAFAGSLAMVGRAVGSHSHLPILANVMLASDEGQLRLSATDLTVGITVWMDANMDGSLALTLPAHANRCGQRAERVGGAVLGQRKARSGAEKRQLQRGRQRQRSV